MTSAKMIQQYKVALSPGSFPVLLLTVQMKFGRTSRNEVREELRTRVGAREQPGNKATIPSWERAYLYSKSSLQGSPVIQ